MRLLRLTGRSGSALPGLIVERVDSGFLPAVLSGVQGRLVLVTGTNGKTTTTKMLVAALRGIDKRVVTNTTGSNMTRGLISALVEDMTYTGKLKESDYFIFEIDEAYAPILTKRITPKMLIGLNVLRDQLDRYGELDTTASMIGEAAGRADIFIYNKLDPLLEKQAMQYTNRQYSFGVSSELRSSVVNEAIYVESLAVASGSSDFTLLEADDGDVRQGVVVSFEGSQTCRFVIPVQGFHNALNAVAVAAATYVLEPDGYTAALEHLTDMPIPFGRGEALMIAGKEITVALVKNPSGFTNNLKTFVGDKGSDEPILFVVNDRLADGRDVSWLWDVDFEKLLPKNRKLFVSGIRAYDMAVRLQQAGLVLEAVNTDVDDMITEIISLSENKVVIIPTYTALFEVRSSLGRYGEAPKIW